MHNEVNIRPMKINEVGILSKLWNKLVYNQMSRDIYYDKDPRSLLNLDISNHFKDCFYDSKRFVFVAEYKDILIGYAELWFKKKDFFFFEHEDYAYILNIFVDKESSPNINPLFIPSKLLQACEKKAIELGFGYIGGDVFDFNTQMKTLLKLYHISPYRTRYIKKTNC